MEPFGFTRASIRSRHALITPDTHVSSPLTGWRNASAFVHISPQLGARFTQYTAMLQADASSAAALPGVERFIFVQDGAMQLQVDGQTTSTIQSGGFAWLAPDTPHRICASHSAVMVVFEKEFQPLPDVSFPSIVTGHDDDVQAEPYMNDADVQLKTLLPSEPSFDMAVNIFTFQPGAMLPQVEIHVMEHGLLMLQGAGVYRLGDHWYPVQAGDVIWMASYCPQWFVAIGKTPTRYLYYKDVHRDSLDA